jgi:molybdopterin synthase catalytic subunit
MIQITRNPIDMAGLISGVGSSTTGAVVAFVGTTREMTGDKRTVLLEYECYERMALAELGQLVNDACRRWALDACSIVHRVGSVPAGESSVAIVVASAHRAAAYEASRWIIETIKKRVPIWKKEVWSDGTSEWVHPGSDEAS